MKINTVLTDLDGTLLNGDGRLSSRTLHMADVCKKNGVRIICVSGRIQAGMRPVVEQLDMSMPYIGGNGSQIIAADHTPWYSLTLDRDTAREILLFLKRSGLYAHIYCGNRFYYETDCEEARFYGRYSGLEGVAVGDLIRFVDFPVMKIMGISRRHDAGPLLSVANEAFRKRAVFTSSDWSSFLEAGPVGATKGDAVRILAEMLGDVEPEHTVAFGDSINDVSLLAFTPNSVAMGNACEEVRKMASYVCPSNTEDGVAQFVERYILPPT